MELTHPFRDEFVIRCTKEQDDKRGNKMGEEEKKDMGLRIIVIEH